jgi:hypothetical protein
MKGVVVELREWQTKTPEKGNELYNRFLDDEPAKQMEDGSMHMQLHG